MSVFVCVKKARFEVPQIPGHMYCCIAEFGSIGNRNSQAPSIECPVKLKPNTSTAITNAEIYRAKTMATPKIVIWRTCNSPESARCALTLEMQLSEYLSITQDVICVGTSLSRCKLAAYLHPLSRMKRCALRNLCR